MDALRGLLPSWRHPHSRVWDCPVWPARCKSAGRCHVLDTGVLWEHRVLGTSLPRSRRRPPRSRSPGKSDSSRWRRESAIDSAGDRDHGEAGLSEHHHVSRARLLLKCMVGLISHSVVINNNGYTIERAIHGPEQGMYSLSCPLTRVTVVGQVAARD